METGAITGYIDVAQIVLYAFWIFFAGLIFYLRREDRREGYPLESEYASPRPGDGLVFIPEPKEFELPHGGSAFAPNGKADDRELKAEKFAPWPGAPLVPTGNPMLDGIGPGAYAERADVPDELPHGGPRIVPLRVATEFQVVDGDPDPRGMAVVGADGEIGGKVTEVWVDRGEHMLRYLEVALPDTENPRTVLLPVPFSVVHASRREVEVSAITGAQFMDVPPLRNPDQVTLLEEDKIAGYYGGGTLYATRERAEPII